MTNSAPKMNNKVERHGSPNGNGAKRQQHNNRTSSIKTTTYHSSTGKNNNNNNSINNSNNNTNNTSNQNGSATKSGRMSCSPPLYAKNARNSPSKSAEQQQQQQQSPRGSPTSNFYAGAKFSEPPSPASLPKPPSHWTTRLMTSCKQSETCCNISSHLKMILNVQA